MSKKGDGIYDNPDADEAFLRHQENEKKRHGDDFKDKRDELIDDVKLDEYQIGEVFAMVDRLERKGLTEDEIWEKANQRIEEMKKREKEKII